MSIDSKLDSIQNDVNSLKSRNFETSRPGLYIAVGAILLSTWGLGDHIQKKHKNITQDHHMIMTTLNEQEAQISKLKAQIPKIKTLDVTGDKSLTGEEAIDTFYEIDGERVYLKIDGRPVEDYFK